MLIYSVGVDNQFLSLHYFMIFLFVFSSEEVLSSLTLLNVD
jgi:hypothetical protein